MDLKFPENFTWGCATSAYQIEGAWDSEGKGPSIWDAFCMIPGKIHENQTGQRACDHFHKIDEDVALMQSLGLRAYRFSISWPRILPTGRGSINPYGIQFYNYLINKLIDTGIEPWVTLYHWDLPLALQLETGGWMEEGIADIFATYADICFKYFGDRVKNWITLNESWVMAVLGHGTGQFAPGYISSNAPYQVGHNLLRAHAKAVKVYRDRYQVSQQGRIGISNNCDWREPLTQSPADRQAADRSLEFFLCWFADPIYRGDYPESMKIGLGNRLPHISDEDRRLILGSSDFFGLNHYTTMYAADAPEQTEIKGIFGNGGTSADQKVSLSVSPEWNLTEMNWAVVPSGCRKLLHWISERFGNPPIFITENGCAYKDIEVDGKIDDQNRIHYLHDYLKEILQAMQEGVDVRGYFVWSLMDNFEWASGYSKQFGIIHVNPDTMERTPKASAFWYTNVIRNNGLTG